MSSPLVSVEHLAAALDEADASPAIVLVDVRWTLNGPPGRGVYEAGHLPARSTWTWSPS